MNSTIAAACLAALVLAACASGGRGPGRDLDRGPGPDGAASGRVLVPAGLLLASFDADGDYLVTRAEVSAGAARAFAAADADGNGAVTLIELGDWRERAFGDPTALPGPYAYDRDQNGAITPAEFARALQTAAEAVADGDGSVPFAALTEALPDRGPRREREDRRALDEALERQY